MFLSLSFIDHSTCILVDALTSSALYPYILYIYMINVALHMQELAKIQEQMILRKVLIRQEDMVCEGRDTAAMRPEDSKLGLFNELAYF